MRMTGQNAKGSDDVPLDGEPQYIASSKVWVVRDMLRQQKHPEAQRLILMH
jgi:hypothetical protein